MGIGEGGRVVAVAIWAWHVSEKGVGQGEWAFRWRVGGVVG